ncbi:hypothetical protein GCM10007049_00500 [Echinicola pacifica]|uniref:Lipocalin-like domain-containing protein n=1 Tax=Echinicola pacifica TaxID=346377 RepID=A0A918PKE2_9BACT|nr:hypothetical protein [Echinicola pacifica]GGZ12712.1 hypothetical protein GCM10007049_00500 [Echinicola pacifica]
MKKPTLFTSLLSLVLVSSILFSCSSSDEEKPKDNASIVGTWELVDVGYSAITTYVDMNESESSSYSGVGTRLEYEITFTENPNTYEAMGNYDILLSYEFDGQPIEVSVTITDFWKAGEYEIDGNMISVQSPNMTNEKCFISSLTDTKLELDFVGTISNTVDEVTVSTVLGAHFIFTKK